jgi:hypothetical protein
MRDKVPQNEGYTFHCHFLKKDCVFFSTAIGVYVVSCPAGAIELCEKLNEELS